VKKLLKNKLPLFLVMCMVLMISDIYAYASEVKSMSFEEASGLMLYNSRIRKNMDKIVLDMEYEYNKAVELSVNIDIYDSPTLYARMLLLNNKHLEPEQKRCSWEAASQRRIITQNTLIVNLRGYYTALLGAKSNFRNKEKEYVIAVQKFKNEEVKYKNGQISSYDLEEAEYELCKMEIERNIENRNYEKECRNFNAYIGNKLDTFYDEISFENMICFQLKDLEYYINQALNFREEINIIKWQIKLKKLEIGILEKDNVNIIYTDVKRQHSDITKEINDLELNLQKTQLAISNEIKDAYFDIKSSYRELSMMETRLNTVKRNLSVIKAKYIEGIIPRYRVSEEEIKIEEMEDRYNISIFNYNTKVMKFKNACLSGPGY